MDILLGIGFGNALVATLLALVAASVGLVCRRPAVVHGLWLLVLLKLLTPPLLPVAVPWRVADKPERPESAPFVGGAESAEAGESPGPLLQQPIRALDVDSPEPGRDNSGEVARTWVPSWQPVVTAGWLAGSLAWFTLAGLRIGRFRRLLRHAHRAPAALQEQTRQLAQRLGLARVPEVWSVPAPVSPLVWALAGRPRILLPAALWQHLTGIQCETLLLHELAHLRRGDHWVRRLEFLALGLYWWHPVAWWARRALQEVEEQCCDAWVVETLPGAAPAYAEALVQTAAFLSGPRPALPLGASGIGHVHPLKRRVTMILCGTTPRKLSRAGCLGMLALGLAVLPLLPTAAQQPAQEPMRGLPAKDIVPPASDRPAPPEKAPDRFTTVNPYQRGVPSRTPATPPVADRSEEIQKLRDEIELLEVQLEVKHAQLQATQQRLNLAQQRLKSVQQLTEKGAASESLAQDANRQVVDLQSQLRIQQAEAREPEVRLKQARRRLASLEQPAGDRKPVEERPLDDRANLKELERKIDALQKAIDALRRDMRPPASPRSEKPQEVNVVPKRDFDIPIRLDPTKQREIEGIVLWVSRDQGASWSKAARVTPDKDHISFHAPADGEYWFTVSTLKKREAEPNYPEWDIGSKGTMKVRIDTSTRATH